MKKLSSYQKLKKQLSESEDYNRNLLNDPKFYAEQYLTIKLMDKLRKDVDRKIMFGDHEFTPTEFKGLLNDLSS